MPSLKHLAKMSWPHFRRNGFSLWVLCGIMGARYAEGNWLLQCTSCVDQAYFGDTQMKENIQDADLKVLMAQLKRVRIREFDHTEDEFYNKFFSRRQLGIVAQELQSVMPAAVALLPERRWTNSKGVTNQSKNIMMLRDSHLLFVALGSLQILAGKAEVWDETMETHTKEIRLITDEQVDNRRKREEILDQIVRVVAKVEVLQHALVKTEHGFVRLDADVAQFKARQEENYIALKQSVGALENKTDMQDLNIAAFQAEFRAAVDREARADLVEKRKKAESDLEVALVRRSIEQMKWEEEQKTINLRAEEQRRNEDHSSKLHQARVAHELAQKKAADLELMEKQEESNIRQEEAKRAGEKELLLLRLASDERRAEMGVQEAIERAKIEQEAKIRSARENEDVNLRALKTEMEEKRAQLLAAIKATADIAAKWVSSVYGSPWHLALGIGSVIAAMGGVYLMREMSILLREQLNKRMGRPSLVRSTNRRGFTQQAWLFLLRLLRLRGGKGSEFNDVVLHPKLRQQVMRLADATRSAKQRRMPLQHAMFYGPPGTGKTMVAQRFAEYSGLEYAIMSGGDVAPLQEQAVTELHKLFQWVHRSKKGVLLFIDEADAFLCSRKNSGMSESLRNALTTMLYHTGTPSSQFMLVIATNRPGDLDSAIIDRIDESVEFGLPDVDARKGMINLYFQMYISKPLGIQIARSNGHETSAKSSGLRHRFAKLSPYSRRGPSEPLKEELVDEEALQEAAARLHGFSGREISKLFTSMQTHILYSGQRSTGNLSLTKSMLFEVVDQKVLEHGRSAEFQVSGYNYRHLEVARASNGTSSVLDSPKSMSFSGGLALHPISSPKPDRIIRPQSTLSAVPRMPNGAPRTATPETLTSPPEPAESTAPSVQTVSP